MIPTTTSSTDQEGRAVRVKKPMPHRFPICHPPVADLADVNPSHTKPFARENFQRVTMKRAPVKLIPDTVKIRKRRMMLVHQLEVKRVRDLVKAKPNAGKPTGDPVLLPSAAM